MPYKLIQKETRKQRRVEEALKNIKEGKPGEEDSIEPEMITYLREERERWLHLICDEAWKKERLLTDWENNPILPFITK